MVKALVRHQVEFFTFNEIYKCYLQQKDLTISLVRATKSLANTLGYLEVSLWPTIQLY